MSVLSCRRAGCENIMCDRYSYKYGYLCNSCFDELVKTNPSDIRAFMETEPKFIEVENTYEKFDKIFKYGD